jgi:pimeloyl-ACP methyl ester carboxylesterase
VLGLGELLSLGGNARLYKAALARCFHTPDRREVDYYVDYSYATRTDGVARAAYLATLRDVRVDFETHADDYRRALTTLQLPVMLIHGRQDRVVPAEHCAEVAGVLRHAVVRWVDACGHFPQIEHVEAVNGWLVDFLVGRPAPR